MPYTAYVEKSPRKDKKWRSTIMKGTTLIAVVDFGQAGASDYPQHKDPDRKKRYLLRHARRENWTRTGIKTAGWWSRHLLWSEPTFKQAADRIEKIYNIKVIFR